ncbi:Imm1 family immunity protein [Amycolatopsis sp. cg5]|uniref:Imm1 family immunity protein n=1 Tax=Amycolatopsis sp. cg5 TaxID=3238802 RepID=UPI003524445E
MVELEVWYDQEPENDLGPGAPAIVVGSVVELDELLNRVLEETKDNRLGQMVQVGIKGNGGYPVLEVGVGMELGFITYHDEIGGSTKGEGSPDELVPYVYMGNVSEVAADAEVPMSTVRRGLHEFLTTGERPSVVETDAS